MRARLEFNLHDLWVGVYWTFKPAAVRWVHIPEARGCTVADVGDDLHVYICPLPAVVIHLISGGERRCTCACPRVPEQADPTSWPPPPSVPNIPISVEIREGGPR